MQWLKDLDGSGRVANKTQLEVLKFIAAEWSTSSVIGINAPVGSGKSFIARTIQRAVPGAVIIAPNNALIAQYTSTYQELNECIGKEHYSDEIMYIMAIARYHAGNPSIFNPMSFWYKSGASEFSNPPCIIVDEADTVLPMLQRLGDRSFKISPKDAESTLLNLLTRRLANAETLFCKQDCSEKTQKLRTVRYKSAQRLLQEQQTWGHLYSHTYCAGECIISPLIVLSNVQQKFFNSAKIILLSATLAPQDLTAITGRDQTIFKSFSSPIEVTRRPVFAGDTLSFDPRYGTDISGETRLWIDNLKPLGNGLVHTTYETAGKFGQLWPDVVAHTAKSKAAALNKFKQDGGVLIGAGMSTGIDLPGDFCRWNLIPRLQFPNLSDSAVSRRLALHGGKQWYEFEALRHVMQATGRSTRSPEDWSATVILDPRFGKLFNKYYSSLPEWFRESTSFQKGAVNGFINSHKNVREPGGIQVSSLSG